MIKQEDIIVTIETNPEQYEERFLSTDNITKLDGIGDDLLTALQDHIVEIILYYEEKLEKWRQAEHTE